MASTELILRMNARQFLAQNERVKRQWKSTSREISTSSKVMATSVQGDFKRIELSALSARKGLRLSGAAIQGILLAGGAAAAGLVSTIKTFAEFEKGVIAVGKTADLEGRELDKFTQRIKDLSNPSKGGIPVATNDLLQLAAAAAQLGVKGEDNLVNFSRILAELGEASDVQGEEGAKDIVRILGITNESINQVDQFSNVLVGLGNNVAASEQEILNLATRVAQGTSSFDVSSTEILGIAAGMRSLGIEAELAGSVSLKSFIAIQGAIENGGSEMAKFSEITGKTREELAQIFQANNADAFEEFVGGLKKAQDQGQTLVNVLEELGINDIRAVSTLGTLAKGYDTYSAAIKRARIEAEKNNARSKEASKVFESEAAKIDRLNNSTKAIGVELGRLTSNLNIPERFAETFETIGNVIDSINDSIERAALRREKVFAILFGDNVEEESREIEKALEKANFSLVDFLDNLFDDILGIETKAEQERIEVIKKSEEQILEEKKKAKAEQVKLAKEKKEAVVKAQEEEVEALEKAIGKQVAAAEKQKAALLDIIKTAEDVQKKLAKAKQDVLKPQDDGETTFSDLNAATSGARIALNSGDLDKALELGEQGIDIINQLRQQGDLSGLQASGALKDLEKIINPAAERLKAKAQADVELIDAAIEQFKDIKIDVNDASIDAAATKTKNIFEQKLKGLSIPGATDPTQAGRDRLAKVAAVKLEPAVFDSKADSLKFLKEFSKTRFEGVDSDPVLKNVSEQKLLIDLVIDNKNFVAGSKEEAANFVTRTVNDMFKQTGAAGK